MTKQTQLLSLECGVMDLLDRRRRLLLGGYFRIALGVPVLVAVPLGLLAVLGAMQPGTRISVGRLEIFLVTTLVIVSSRWATERFQRGKQLVAAAQNERVFNENVDFVLYLRGFLDDIVASQTLGKPTLWQHAFANFFRLPLTEEEHLARALGAYCPVAAIGRPGEELPILGATRQYVDEETWQQRVRDLMHRSRMVVLRLGPHMGLAWELETALTELPPEKLVVLVPGESSLLGAWATLEQKLGRRLPYFIESVEPASQLGTLRGLVFLTRQGEPLMYQLPNRAVRKRLSRYPLADALDDAFGPLLARVGVHRLPRPMLFRRGAAFVLDFTVLTGLDMLIDAVSFISNWEAIRAGIEPAGGTAVPGAGVMVTFLPLGAYLVACEAFFGRTIGKLATRLEVTSTSNRWFAGRVLIRNVIKIATLATIALPQPFGLIVLLALCILPSLVWRMPLHDLLSGTRVVGRSSIRDVLTHGERANVAMRSAIPVDAP